MINGMGRPRTTSDDDILAAAARVVTRLGPHGLTLAQAAAECGLAPATLVQRFGSKRGLLLALAGRSTATVGEPFEAARAGGGSPLEALRSALQAMAGFAATPEALANHLALFQIDLREPDFHALALAHARALREEIATLLDEAVATGELASCDTARLARAVQVTFNGSLVTWAVHREGPVDEWLADDLDAVLSPVRSRSR
jgi:AcrR family transcriptional regulator